MKSAFAILLAVLAVALASPGIAQQAASKAAATPGAAAETPAPSADEDTDAVQQRAQRLSAAGAEPAVQNAIASVLQREEENFRQRLRSYLDANDAVLSAIAVLELRDALTRAQLSLDVVRERRRALAAGIAQARRARDELTALHEGWSRRLSVERENGSPPALLERIATLLKAIDTARDDLRARSQSLLELDNRLVALQDQLSTVSARLDEALRDAHRRLFRVAEPPLWVALNPARGAHATGAAQLGSEWTRAARTTRDFWQNFSERLVLHLVVLGLLLGAMASLSYSPGIRALEALSGSVRVLKRPFSSAFLVALLLSPVIYPGLPLVLNAILRLLSLVPIWRLIPTFVPAVWRPLFYWVAGLFGLDTLYTLLPEGTGLSRLALLAMSVAALWVATIGVRPPFADPAFARWRWARLARAVARLVSLLLVAAIVGNLFGATNLALLINLSIVAPAYLGIGLAAAVFVIEDFVRLLLHSNSVQGLRSVTLHRPQHLRRSAALTRWLAFAMWLWLTLRVLGIESSVVNGVTGLLTASTTLGTFQLSLGRILLFVLAVWIAVLTARAVSFVLGNDVLPRLHLARGLPGTITTTSQYLIIGLGLLIAASIAGVDLSHVALILGALSVGIGFGLQNIVNNFISGLILLFERPIQVGDTIQVGSLTGVVRSIGIRSSNVRTYGGAEVIVPNADLVSGQVINWTLSDRYRRLELDVGVAYGNRPADVVALLEKVAREHEAALKTPAPFVRFRGFGDSSLDFRVYVWVDYDEGLAATSAILSAIYDALAEAGIEIPFPQRDLHLRSVSAAAGQALRGEKR
jgi:potassium efflux system protein